MDSSAFLQALNDYRISLGLAALTQTESDEFVRLAEASKPETFINLPPPVVPPTVSFTLPSTLTGSVSWQVTATDPAGIAKVDFYVDDVLKWSEAFAPYVFNGDGKTLDTTKLANGPHTLKAVATNKVGTSASLSQTVSVSNSVTPPPSTKFIVAVNGGSWGTGGAADLRLCVDYVRFSRERSDTTLHNYLNAGLKVIALFFGPYSSSGVSGVGDPTKWAQSQLAWYKANCTPTNTPVIEILNEPYGSWFWGSSATSQTNADAYARLLKATWTVFHAEYGSNAPAVLGAYDTWGSKWWNSSAVSNVGQYVDGITIHPYGGASGNHGGANGDRALVTASHTATGKPVYVTEVGWPTCGGTSDSQSWSESQQASNIYNFVNWARATGYVNCVSIYNDRDESGSRCYGIMHSNGTHKPAYDSLHKASLGQ